MQRDFGKAYLTIGLASVCRNKLIWHEWGELPHAAVSACSLAHKRTSPDSGVSTEASQASVVGATRECFAYGCSDVVSQCLPAFFL